MLIKYLRFLFLVFGSLFTFSCIEEFKPDIDDYEDQLVVHGVITNMDEPYVIKLSKTSPLDNPGNRPLSGATVVVEDDAGNVYEFLENNLGEYQSTGFVGELGKSYRCRINTDDGNVYESAYQLLSNATSIDSIYSNVETRPTEDPYYDEIGLQFYVSASSAANNQNYYMWQLEEAYEFNSDYPIEYTYSGRFEAYPEPLEFFTCWAINKIEDIFLFDATVLSSGDIQNVPLNYVNTETRKLSIRYSLLVNQYLIDEDTYSYYKSVQEMNSGDDLFYGTQPYQIAGNIECITNPDEKVLGLFWTAGKSVRRIFLNRPVNLPFYYEICPINTQGVPFIGNYSHTDWPIYLTYNSNGELGIVGKACVDCTERGGSLGKPEFWIDN